MKMKFNPYYNGENIKVRSHLKKAKLVFPRAKFDLSAARKFDDTIQRMNEYRFRTRFKNVDAGYFLKSPKITFSKKVKIFFSNVARFFRS